MSGYKDISEKLTEYSEKKLKPFSSLKDKDPRGFRDKFSLNFGYDEDGFYVQSWTKGEDFKPKVIKYRPRTIQHLFDCLSLYNEKGLVSLMFLMNYLASHFTDLNTYIEKKDEFSKNYVKPESGNTSDDNEEEDIY